MTPLIDQFSEGRLELAEEARLAKKAHRGDTDAANTLVMATMREALKYTQRTCRNSIADSERVSLCYRKLMMCVRRFDPTRGIRFFAFAKAALRGQMKTFWENQDVVRNAAEIVSVDTLSGWRGARRAASHRPCLAKTFIHTPHPPLGQEDDREESIREQVTGEVEQPAMEHIFNRDRWAEIEKLIQGKLNDRERMVLTLTYKSGLNFPEIGKLLGFTRSLIHAVHRGAIKKIRDEIAVDGRLLEE